LSELQVRAAPSPCREVVRVRDCLVRARASDRPARAQPEEAKSRLGSDGDVTRIHEASPNSPHHVPSSACAHSTPTPLFCARSESTADRGITKQKATCAENVNDLKVDFEHKASIVDSPHGNWEGRPSLTNPPDGSWQLGSEKLGGGPHPHGISRKPVSAIVCSHAVPAEKKKEVPVRATAGP
ncbi:MAG: hypothetical protein BJ554DRAFT_3203, partial [Olpidium bornovanus]